MGDHDLPTITGDHTNRRKNTERTDDTLGTTAHGRDETRGAVGAKAARTGAKAAGTGTRSKATGTGDGTNKTGTNKTGTHQIETNKIDTNRIETNKTGDQRDLGSKQLTLISLPSLNPPTDTVN